MGLNPLIAGLAKAGRVVLSQCAGGCAALPADLQLNGAETTILLPDAGMACLEVGRTLPWP